MTAPTMTVADVAERLGLSKDWLYRTWETLRDQQDFPSPITNVCAPRKDAKGRIRAGRRPSLIWDRQAIEIWIAMQQPPAIRAAMGYAPATPANENDQGPPVKTVDHYML